MMLMTVMGMVGMVVRVMVMVGMVVRVMVILVMGVAVADTLRTVFTEFRYLFVKLKIKRANNRNLIIMNITSKVLHI